MSTFRRIITYPGVLLVVPVISQAPLDTVQPNDETSARNENRVRSNVLKVEQIDVVLFSAIRFLRLIRENRITSRVMAKDGPKFGK